MNDILDKIAALKWPIKLGILGVLLVLVVVGAFMGLIQPNQEGLEKKQKELAKLNQELDKMDAIARDFPAFKAQLEKLRQELKEALNQLPDDSEIPKLLTQVSNLAIRASLEVIDFSRIADVTGQDAFYADVPVNMAVEGTYHNIAKFFQRVGEEERIINIKGVDFKSVKGKSKSIRNYQFDSQETMIQAKFQVVTYRFLSDAERGVAK